MHRLILFVFIFIGCIAFRSNATTPADSLSIAHRIQQADELGETNPEEAIRSFKKIQEEARTAGLDILLAKALYAESYYYLPLGQYDKVIPLATEAATLFHKFGMLPEEAKCDSRLGVARMYSNEYGEALHSLFKAKEIAEEIGDKSITAAVNNNIGLVYESLNDWENALSFALKGLSDKEVLRDTIGLARSYNNIANLYYYLNDYDQALAGFKQAMHYNNLYGDKYLEATLNSDIGNLLADMGELDSAIFYQNKALLFHSEKKEARFVEWCQTVISLGSTLLKKGDTAKSGMHLQQCKPCEDKINDIIFLKSLYSFRSEYYLKSKNFEQAALNLRKLNTINDSLSVHSGNLKNQRIAIQYEFNQKAREDSLRYQLSISQQETIAASYKNKMFMALIALMVVASIASIIVFKIRRSQHRKRKLELEAMRNSIAEDLHDDVGSTLSSIQIISNIMQSQSESDPKVKDAAAHISQLSAKVASGIREIVWALNPANDSVDVVSNQLRKIASDILSVSSTPFNFEQKIETPSKKIQPQTRKDLMMVYTEVINNSRKYSNSTLIQISIVQRGNSFEFSIKDNGCGFDLNTAHSGNGLNNMKRRADGMKAELTILSEIGKGTEIKLKTPLT